MKELNPKIKQVLREIYGDTGVNDSDYDLVSHMLKEYEITHYRGKGRLCYNGEWTPFGTNKLLQYGPKIAMRRLFNVSTVPSIPTTIVLGNAPTPSYDRTAAAGVNTIISDAGLVFAAADPGDVVISTTNANYADDTCTITYDWGTLTLSSGPYTVTEMALRNTDGTALHFNWIDVTDKPISSGGSLVGQAVVQVIP